MGEGEHEEGRTGHPGAPECIGGFGDKALALVDHGR